LNSLFKKNLERLLVVGLSSTKDPTPPSSQFRCDLLLNISSHTHSSQNLCLQHCFCIFKELLSPFLISAKASPRLLFIRRSSLKLSIKGALHHNQCYIERQFRLAPKIEKF